MPKQKKATPKVAKKKSTKYSKLLVVAAKELAAKKKSLVAAERALAKAKAKHEELVAEIARLDMAERSLRAIVEGTEPPTNVRYVYQYPQWVWYPYQPYVTYTVPQWQYYNTAGNTIPSVQGGSFTFTNSGGSLPAINTVNADMSTLNNGAFVGGNWQSGSVNVNCSNSGGLSATSATTTVTSGSNNAVFYNAPLSPGEVVVDLTSHADQVEGTCSECGGPTPEGEPHMHKGSCSKVVSENELAKAAATESK